MRVREIRRCYASGFEDGRGYKPRNVGKGKETDFPLESPEGTRPVNTFTLAQANSFWTSSLQNYKIINLCCLNY